MNILNEYIYSGEYIYIPESLHIPESNTLQINYTSIFKKCKSVHGSTLLKILH